MKGKHTFIFLLLAPFIHFACEPSETRVEDQNESADQYDFHDPYNDIMNEVNPERGVETIEVFLDSLAFDTSLYNEYNLLIVGYLSIRNFTKADSIFALMENEIERFDDEMLYHYYGEKYIYHFLRGESKSALFNVRKKWQLPLEKKKGDISQPLNHYITWSIFSQMKQCDSAAFYLEKYLQTIDSSERLIKYHSMDQHRREVLESILQSPCPLEDTSLVKIPTLVFDFM